MNFGDIVDLPEGGNYILLNTIYKKQTIPRDYKSPDCLTMVFKNLDTGEKIKREIENPKVEIYLAKDGIDMGHYNHIDIPKEYLNKYDVSYKDKKRDMAHLIGADQFYWNCLKQKRLKDLDQLFLYNRFAACDMNIEDFYMYKSRKYFGDKTISNLHKGYFDIECDIKKGKVDLKKVEGDAPINIVTFLDEPTMTLYTIILRDEDNPQIALYEQNATQFISELQEEFKRQFGSFTIKMAFVDTEEQLIKTLFNIVNEIKPDFMLAWNIGFDLPYIIHRCKKLGLDPAEIICHPDFKYKDCFYTKDTRNFEIKRKTDWARISSYTVYMDQMINYAAIRKSGSKIDSYKLDFIAEDECGIGKVHYNGHLKDLPYNDFALFVKYNIRDVIAQWNIESKVNDLDNTVYRSHSSNTRISKVFKETVFLTNVAFHDFEEMGLILGNNVNAILYNNQENKNLIFDEDGNIKEDSKDEKFEGAIIGDPNLLEKVGMLLMGMIKSSALFKNVVDFDYTSLYPTIIYLFNIYKATMLGQLVFSNPEISQRELRAWSEKYNRGAQYLQDLTTMEALHFCYRWLGLPNAADMIREVGAIINKDRAAEKNLRYLVVKRPKKKKKKDERVMTLSRKIEEKGRILNLIRR